MYLNTVPFGSNTFGIHTASRVFFDTQPDKLSYAQAALLVGIINAPTRYSPILNPNNAIRKRNKILKKMGRHSFGNMPARSWESLQAQPLQLRYRTEDHNTGTATYFRKVVRNFMVKWWPNKWLRPVRGWFKDLYDDRHSFAAARRRGRESAYEGAPEGVRWTLGRQAALDRRKGEENKGFS